MKKREKTDVTWGWDIAKSLWEVYICKIAVRRIFSLISVDWPAPPCSLAARLSCLQPLPRASLLLNGVHGDGSLLSSSPENLASCGSLSLRPVSRRCKLLCVKTKVCCFALPFPWIVVCFSFQNKIKIGSKNWVPQYVLPFFLAIFRWRLRGVWQHLLLGVEWLINLKLWK
jgi:hypothetical protein